ncbi:MAG TPA: hypothetical protein VE869_13080 [Gemmatimonas sp.]|nr:hypothetical protein [Gemmatimonas sp.]
MVPPTAAAADSVARAARADSVRRNTVADSAQRADSIPRPAAAKPKSAPAGRPCILDTNDSPPETRFSLLQLDDGTSNIFIGGGFVGRCQGENNRIRADSLEQFQSAGIVNLYGNVVYDEPGRMNLVAAHATYYTAQQLIVADGDVTATQVASGSTFRGPRIEYYRPLAGVRVAPRLVAAGRPTVSVIEKDSAGKPGAPVVITANTLQDEADTLLFGWGSVNIRRNRLTGESDSASYDKRTERARLIRQAKVVNADSAQAFTLVGDTIDMFSKQRALERVLALHKAAASNADFKMTSEKIDLRLIDQKIDQAFASGQGRSTVTTPQQDLAADSIAIFLPAQRVSEVRAIGAAVTTGVPDTTKIKSDDRDVLRGDTVIARFDTARVAGDTVRRTNIRQIQALGNASSFFQIASKRGPTAPPDANYLRAKTIVIAFDSGVVRTVAADSSATGFFIQADSLVDTAAAPPAARPGGRGGRGDTTSSNAGPAGATASVSRPLGGKTHPSRPAVPIPPVPSQLARGATDAVINPKRRQ